jgi:inorganic pyrophosphatase
MSANDHRTRGKRRKAKRASARHLIPIIGAVLCGLACASSQTGIHSADSLRPDGPYKLKSRTNLLTNHMARNQDGTVNVVIEIPAGTSEKWEVSQDGYSLVHEFKGDTPRVVNYLPYPGNYGLIPRTLLDADKGGDGGALDVMVLGPAVARGQVIRARPIGVIRLVDRMEQDDKVLAVTEGMTFQDTFDIDSLKDQYPGVIEILDIWWTHAHGKGTDVSLMGTGSRAQANTVIDYAMKSWLAMRRENRAVEAKAQKEADTAQ